MKFLSVIEIAKKWGISERSVRNYCAQGRVSGAFLTGKTWNIPEDAEKPMRGKITFRTENMLLDILKEQKEMGLKGGIYHKVQIDLTYNSNHIEGSRLSEEQTRYIFETNTIGVGENVGVDDILETVNHFACIDYIINRAKDELSEEMIKKIHKILKSGTSDSRKSWFAVGQYKKLANEVEGKKTIRPNEVKKEMQDLLTKYNEKSCKTLEDIIDFHVKFEKIHPFQDGNGRVGRLIMFKECLDNNIIPFIISEDIKLFYYRGLSEWEGERGFLVDTILTAQDRFKVVLEYFGINYSK